LNSKAIHYLFIETPNIDLNKLVRSAICYGEYTTSRIFFKKQLASAVRQRWIICFRDYTCAAAFVFSYVIHCYLQKGFWFIFVHL